MERKIGEIFEYNGEWYQCIHTKSLGCENCDLATKSDIHCSDVFEIRGECLSCYRKDGKSVIFKKLEKLGEPIWIFGKEVQLVKTTFRCCHNCTFRGENYNCELVVSNNRRSCLGGEEGTYVEIKQNKENMEEREYSEEDMKNNPRFKHHKNIEQVINMQKMKPFDLEAAKAGKPVCTRDGRKARIICFDTINKGNYPIIALLEDKGSEAIFYYNKDGKCNVGTELDLMMLPEKKEGWVNLCKNNSGDTLAVGVFPNREEAVSNCPPFYLCTIKIEWEE